MRWLRFRVEAGLCRLVLFLARLVPRGVLLALGSFGGIVGYYLDRRHRVVGQENLRIAFGDEIDPALAGRILRACWRHFGRISVDATSFQQCDRSQLERLVHYHGLEHVRKAYADGKGVLLFSGHFGHWELIAFMQGYLGMPLALVARPLDNPYLERILADLRGRSGNRVVHEQDAVREMFRTLRDGFGVAIVIDQDQRQYGVFVPFFGRDASTTPTLASLALRTGAAVLPTFSVPRGDGSYDIYYEPPVEVHQSGNRDADVLRLTAECTAILERWVRRHPELWLWMHRRWKTTPEMVPALVETKLEKLKRRKSKREQRERRS